MTVVPPELKRDQDVLLAQLFDLASQKAEGRDASDINIYVWNLVSDFKADDWKDYIKVFSNVLAHHSLKRGRFNEEQIEKLVGTAYSIFASIQIVDTRDLRGIVGSESQRAAQKNVEFYDEEIKDSFDELLDMEEGRGRGRDRGRGREREREGRDRSRRDEGRREERGIRTRERTSSEDRAFTAHRPRIESQAPETSRRSSKGETPVKQSPPEETVGFVVRDRPVFYVPTPRQRYLVAHITGEHTSFIQHEDPNEGPVVHHISNTPDNEAMKRSEHTLTFAGRRVSQLLLNASSPREKLVNYVAQFRETLPREISELEKPEIANAVLHVCAPALTVYSTLGEAIRKIRAYWEIVQKSRTSNIYNAEVEILHGFAASQAAFNVVATVEHLSTFNEVVDYLSAKCDEHKDDVAIMKTIDQLDARFRAVIMGYMQRNLSINLRFTSFISDGKDLIGWLMENIGVVYSDKLESVQKTLIQASVNTLELDSAKAYLENISTSVVGDAAKLPEYFTQSETATSSITPVVFTDHYNLTFLNMSSSDLKLAILKDDSEEQFPGILTTDYTPHFLALYEAINKLVPIKAGQRTIVVLTDNVCYELSTGLTSDQKLIMSIGAQ